MITRHPLWNKLRPYVVVQIYSRDGIVKPRFRLWLKGTPQPILVEVLNMTMPCCACGEEIHPVRCGLYGIYIAGSCELKKKIVCSRHDNVSLMYQEVKRLVEDGAEADVPPEQPELPI